MCFIYMYILYYVCLVPVEVRRGYQTQAWNWSHSHTVCHHVGFESSAGTANAFSH